MWILTGDNNTLINTDNVTNIHLEDKGNHFDLMCDDKIIGSYRTEGETACVLLKCADSLALSTIQPKDYYVIEIPKNTYKPNSDRMGMF